MIKPVTIEDMVKMMNFRSVISFLLKAMMNTLIIEKTVINIIIAEKTLAATSIVKLLSQKSFSYILPPNEWNRHHFLYFYCKDIDNKLRYIELLPVPILAAKFVVTPINFSSNLLCTSDIWYMFHQSLQTASLSF